MCIEERQGFTILTVYIVTYILLYKELNNRAIANSLAWSRLSKVAGFARHCGGVKSPTKNIGSRSAMNPVLEHHSCAWTCQPEFFQKVCR